MIYGFLGKTFAVQRQGHIEFEIQDLGQLSALLCGCHLKICTVFNEQNPALQKLMISDLLR